VPLQDEELTEAFSPLVDRLDRLVDAIGIPRAVFLSHLVPLSSQLDSNRPLATALLAKTVGPQKGQASLSQFTDLLTEFESTFQRVAPLSADELASSAHPLRRDWPAFGPTMLAGIGMIVEPEIIVDSATVVLVPPVGGGGGRAYFLYNAVSIEVQQAGAAAEPALPEIVRLCWLISQLNAELPMYQGEIHRDRLVEIVPLAMIPVALAAAAQIGQARIDEPTVIRAVDTWMPNIDGAPSTGSVLWKWWEAYSTRKPRWTVALSALNELLCV